MNERALRQYIVEIFAGPNVAEAAGYTFFFVDDDRQFPFATIATRDNEFDAASQLDRPGVYRLNLGVGKETFQAALGRTERSSPIAEGEYNFTTLDKVMPHPLYGAMHWLCVLNPSEETMGQVRDWLAEAYALMKARRARKGG